MNSEIPDSRALVNLRNDLPQDELHGLLLVCHEYSGRETKRNTLDGVTHTICGINGGYLLSIEETRIVVLFKESLVIMKSIRLMSFFFRIRWKTGSREVFCGEFSVEVRVKKIR